MKPRKIYASADLQEDQKPQPKEKGFEFETVREHKGRFSEVFPKQSRQAIKRASAFTTLFG